MTTEIVTIDQPTQKRTIKSVVAQLRQSAEARFAKVSPIKDKVKGLAKSNVDAVVVAGKTLGAGLKDIRQGSVVDGRQAIQTVVADVKEMAAMRSPREILRMQGKLTSRNLNSILGFASKNGKALRALASEAIAPLGDRLQSNIAMVRKPA